MIINDTMASILHEIDQKTEIHLKRLRLLWSKLIHIVITCIQGTKEEVTNWGVEN